MGRFGDRIGAVEALAANLVFSAVGALVILLVARRSVDGFAAALRAPWWYWVGGGGMGLLVVFTITATAPRLGTTAVIALLIAGQLAMGAAIDRFGLFGVERIPLTWPRVAGVVLLAAGAALTLRR
jgi:transporter family-2 protein